MKLPQGFVVASLIRERKIDCWSDFYEKSLSEEEHKEISHNLNGFFSVLKEWDENLKRNQEDERNSDLRNSNNPG
jgi:hypothetical protein